MWWSCYSLAGVRPIKFGVPSMDLQYIERVGKLSQVTLELINDAQSIPLSTDTPPFSSNPPDTTTLLLHVTGASDFFQARARPIDEQNFCQEDSLWEKSKGKRRPRLSRQLNQPQSTTYTAPGIAKPGLVMHRRSSRTSGGWSIMHLPKQPMLWLELSSMWTISNNIILTDIQSKHHWLVVTGLKVF